MQGDKNMDEGIRLYKEFMEGLLELRPDIRAERIKTKNKMVWPKIVSSFEWESQMKKVGFVTRGTDINSMESNGANSTALAILTGKQTLRNLYIKEKAPLLLTNYFIIFFTSEMKLLSVWPKNTIFM